MKESLVHAGPVNAASFYVIFMHDAGRDTPFRDAPDCPLVAGQKCDCRTEIRQFAAASNSAHPCGEGGKCPVRTYLATH